VTGVLAEKGSQGSFQNLDEQVLIPLQTARYRVLGTDRLRSITARVADVRNMNLAMIEIERVLRREHKIRPGMDNDFQIRRQADLLSTLEDTTKTFTRLLAGIAAVSLVVGGIGIMNIMLVSVTERTREIGVRKALGATKRVILTQFLVEALVLCLLGGTVGVLLGSAGAIVLSKMNQWNTSISPAAIALAFVFSALVGVFFGMWPARRAAIWTRLWRFGTNDQRVATGSPCVCFQVLLLRVLLSEIVRNEDADGRMIGVAMSCPAMIYNSSRLSELV
jgi:putative ABC transport system permease protein